MSCFQGQRGLDVHCLRTLIFSSTDAGDADDVTDGEGVQNKSQWTKSQIMIWYFVPLIPIIFNNTSESNDNGWLICQSHQAKVKYDEQ